MWNFPNCFFSTGTTCNFCRERVHTFATVLYTSASSASITRDARHQYSLSTEKEGNGLGNHDIAHTSILQMRMPGLLPTPAKAGSTISALATKFLQFKRRQYDKIVKTLRSKSCVSHSCNTYHQKIEILLEVLLTQRGVLVDRS